MAIVTDWIVEAAEEIAGDPTCCDIQSSSASQMAAIIEKHCPFQRDAAYVDVAELEALKKQIDCGAPFGSPSCLSQDAENGPCKRHLVISAIARDARP